MNFDSYTEPKKNQNENIFSKSELMQETVFWEYLFIDSYIKEYVGFIEETFG